MEKKKALILVDLQNDFCQGGNLAVPGGDEIMPLANQLQDYFDVIIATKDWHPQEHMSFAINQEGHNVGEVIVIEDMHQVLWPAHCVQHSEGAEFHPKLDTHKITKIFHKGTDKNIDSYSAFFDNAHKRDTGLGDYLRHEQVEEVYLIGLATDYCVKHSALDAAQLGFHVYVVEDACRGVELKSGDIARALTEMQDAGIKIIQADEIIKLKF